MTPDLIATRRHYRSLYWNWPTTLMVAHLITLDCKVAEMNADELIEARQLMDEKLEKWQRNIGE